MSQPSAYSTNSRLRSGLRAPVHRQAVHCLHQSPFQHSLRDTRDFSISCLSHQLRNTRPRRRSMLRAAAEAAKLIIPLIVYTSLVIKTEGQQPVSSTFNYAINGSTVRQAKGIFTSFLESGVGLGGQVKYPIIVPDGDDVYVTVSTCPAATFDTYIVLFSGLSLTRENVIAESNNDFSCKASKNRSTASARLSPGTYLVLVTGTELSEGSFTLEITGSSTAVSLPWGLDRIDQRSLPLDGLYSIPANESDGHGISVYVLDSGVRSSHEEFEGRVREGFDFVELDKTTQDCSGFGTHAAGIIAGKSYGVARKAEIVSVRILDCSNTALVSNVIDAIEWVLLDIQYQPLSQIPAVIFLRFHSSHSQVVNNAVTSAVRFGIPVIVPAGDYSNEYFCNTTSPASSDSALVVGSTDVDDRRSVFSNYGECVNLYAPGSNVTSALHTSDTARTARSGTAQAAAHVTGIAAILMSINSGVGPRDLKSILTSLGSVNIVKNASKENSEYTPRFAFVRSIPLFPKKVPPEKKVYIYFVLDFLSVRSKLDDTCGSDVFGNKLRDAIEVPEKSFFGQCFPLSSNMNNTALFRVLETERGLTTTSSRIQQVLVENRKASERNLGTKYEVLEEPWYVDANGFVFWGEPQFSKPKKSILTPGAISGIVCGILVTLVILSVICYSAYRKATGKDDIESMEGSADFERGPTHFDDYPVDQVKESPIFHVKRSFRNAMSMNFMKSNSRRQDTFGGASGDAPAQDGHFRDKERVEFEDSDVLRMQSYGAEAFAKLISGENRSQHNASVYNAKENSPFNDTDYRAPSFRSSIAMGLTPDSMREALASPSSVDSVRMRSLGGEAFASLLQGWGNSTSHDEKSSPHRETGNPESASMHDIKGA